MASPVETGAIVYRGDGIEAVHKAGVAVVNGDGTLVYLLGDPTEMFMARSSVKPFQAIPLVMTGGADRYQFSSKQLAITCASHNGSDEHRELVMSNLKAAGNQPSDLQCGAHWPLGMKERSEYPYHEEDKDPVRHNCSGKHSGFLALSRHLGEDVADYLNPAGKVQTMVKEAVAAMCEFPASRIPVGVDGCSAPNFGLPLVNLALGFKKLAAGEARDPEMAKAVKRLRDAMLEYPKMISGEGRMDYDIARSFPGRLVCKIGAEAVEGIGLVDPPMGIAVKILDGGERALGPVILEVLKQIGFITGTDGYPYLKRHERPEVRNNRNLLTGHVTASFRLQKL